MKAGVALYRGLPISGAAKRKLKAALMGGRPAREPFPHPFRAGLKFWCDLSQGIDLRIYYAGDYEPETMRAIAKQAEIGSTVIDVGANIGLVSLWLSKCVGPSGKVIAIDPSAWAIGRLKHNVELNALRNVEPIVAAVGDTAGETDMQIINGYRVDDVSTHSQAHVDLVTIDDIVAERGITNLSLIKVDTDGFEVGVFRGAMKTLADLRPNLVFEMGPDHLRKAGSSREELVALLEDAGYEFLTEKFEPVDPLTVHVGEFDTFNLIGRPKA